MAENKIPTSTLRMFQKSAPVDLRGMAQALGINAWVSHKLPPGISGKLFKDSQHGGTSGYSIQVNAADPYVRRRFTVAHELAHFILHRELIGLGIVDNELYRSGLPDQKEFEANRLAADILMPRHLLLRYSEDGTSADAMARQFKVSTSAMRIQLESLGKPENILA